MAHIIAMSYNTEHNRTANKQLLVTGVIVTCTLATVAYFGIQNLIHNINKQPNPTQPNIPLFTPENVTIDTETPTPAIKVQKVDCINVYGQELLQNHKKITITINGRTMSIEPNTPIELCGIPVTPTP